MEPYLPRRGEPAHCHAEDKGEAHPQDSGAQFPATWKMISETDPWYAVLTKPAREKYASENLERQGFIVFLPMEHIFHNRRLKCIRPLFNRYVFVSFDVDTAPWVKIGSTYGCRDVVRNGAGAPSPISSRIITAIRNRDERPPDPFTTGYRAGQTIKILDGPFASFPATFLAEEAESCDILVEIFGRSTLCHVPLDQIADDPHT
jgi:transcriptional antiterminator RfaH